MDNLAGILGKIDESKPLIESGGNFPFTKRKELQAGRYQLRFCANDEKCPDGFRIYTVHDIQRKAHQGSRWDLSMDEIPEYYSRVLCTESYKGWKQTENGLKLAQPCPVCDVYEDFLQSYDKEEVDEDILKALNEMSSISCRRFLYPVLAYAAQTEIMTDRNKKKKVWVPNDRQCVGLLLNLLAKNYEGNADLTLIRYISETVMCDEEHLSSRRGRWFNYEKKSNGQSLTPGEKGPLSDKEMENLKNFPNVASYGMGESDSPFAKNYKLGYDKGMALMGETWFIKSAARNLDYNLEGVQRGLV